MAITLTESAAKQIQAQLAKRGNGLGLRVGVKKVGCSGFAYTYDYADEVRADDQLFEVARNEGRGRCEEPRRSSKGSTLDYVKEGLKQAFKFENPNVDAHVRLRRKLQRERAVSGQRSAVKRNADRNRAAGVTHRTRRWVYG